jgi:uncharacterized RDD family membrane protein YckC
MYPVAYSGGPPNAGPAPGIGYAGFWIRFVAAFIDGIIIGVPLFVVFLLLDGSTLKAYSDCVNTALNSGVYAGTCSSTLTGSIGLFELLALGVQFLYFVGLWSQLGGTLGQRMLGLHVVDAATGKHIGVGRAIGRFIGYIISSAVLSIGLIWAAFDPRKQGWHDKMASTFVVRKV